jgi:hypothetical protein
MTLVKDFLGTFSNREIAIAILASGALALALIKKDIRSSLFGAIKTLFSKGLRTYGSDCRSCNCVHYDFTIGYRLLDYFAFEDHPNLVYYST